MVRSGVRSDVTRTNGRRDPPSARIGVGARNAGWSTVFNFRGTKGELVVMELFGLQNPASPELRVLAHIRNVRATVEREPQKTLHAFPDLDHAEFSAGHLLRGNGLAIGIPGYLRQGTMVSLYYFYSGKLPVANPNTDCSACRKYSLFQSS